MEATRKLQISTRAATESDLVVPRLPMGPPAAAGLFVERPAVATEEQVQTPVSVALAVVEAAALISQTAKRKSPNVNDFCKTYHRLSDTVLSNARKRVIGHLKTD